MRVHLDPVGLHSPAMIRVAKALAEHAPPEVEIVPRPNRADVRVLHVIDAVDGPYIDQSYVVIQYCLRTTRWHEPEQWLPMWSKARLVWSYYNLNEIIGADMPGFYHAPLGIDHTFTHSYVKNPSRNLVVTMGHVTGPCAEAIEEVWDAAEESGLRGVHVGPATPEGATRALPKSWRHVSGISDRALMEIYTSAKYVCALRHIEGFELPAAEGLAGGARPILFDQPALRHWYGDSAIYLPDCAGNPLVRSLREVFEGAYVPVRDEERHGVTAVFDWKVIANGFWTALLDREAGKS